MRRIVGLSLGMSLLLASAAEAQSLKGSSASLSRQNRVARAHDYSYLRTSAQVRDFAERGLLVRVSNTSHVRLTGVSFPYARPEVKLFVERLGRQYHAACGEKLVVTSLTRPWSRQPANASDRSVHPTGMAMDLRVSQRGSCERWLSNTLLDLERAGVLEATRERRPPHFHVALFPQPYRQHVAALEAANPRKLAQGRVVRASIIPLGVADDAGAVQTVSYRVNRGDTLWEIARRHGTTVEVIKQVNKLDTPSIRPGDVLALPAK